MSNTLRDYVALVRRVQAAVEPPLTCRVYGQQHTPDHSATYDLLLVRVPTRRARFSVLLNGGTHGDEPAGTEAVVHFLEDRRYVRWPDVEFTLTPCTNPWGYVHNRRESAFGVDLNRSFRRATAKAGQISLLKRALARRRFDLFVDCHEDVDSPGLYVFAPAALGRAIVDAVRPLGPVHAGDLVDGEIPVVDGVVALDTNRSGLRRRTFTTWPYPYYIARYHYRDRHYASGSATPRGAAAASGAEDGTPPADPWMMRSATVETPTSLPIEQRVRMHHAAIDAALASLTDK